MAGLEAFDSPVDMTDAARTFGVTPTSVDDFVASVRAPPNAVAPAADART
jgi:hypothetical protein